MGPEGPLKRWPQLTEEVRTRTVTGARGLLGQNPGGQSGGGPCLIKGILITKGVGSRLILLPKKMCSFFPLVGEL